jgi:dTDP-3,4-didehydro-2,6-dideoxy-alpha-D-glucose 3-reductase
MDTAKPGIVVWGVGDHARRNLIPAIGASPWRLAGLLSRNQGLMQEIAAPLGVRVYADPAEMLSDSGVAAVLLAGPNGVHYQQAKAVLNAGKAALVEKSFCDTYDQAAELAGLAEARGLLVAECFSYVFHPQFQRFKAALDAAGQLMSLTARFGFPFRAPSDIRYRDDLAGGALLDVGAYCLSVMDRLIPGPVRVKWAKMDRASGYQVDTGGVAVVQGQGGVIGLCDWGFGRAYRNEMEAWGDTASLFAERLFAKPADLATSIRVSHQRNNRVEKVDVPADNAFVQMLTAMEAARNDPAAQKVLRQEILSQAALIAGVRSCSRLQD